MKKCKGCGKNKPLNQFWKAKKNTIAKTWGKCKSCMSKRRKENKWDDSLGVRYHNYRNHNKRECRAGQVFDLTKEQFDALTAQLCTYCNSYSPGKQFCGVDRVDDMVGYTPDNCVPCCGVCNFMKSNMSRADFLAHITRIYTHTQ